MHSSSMKKTLYQQIDFPVLQNRVYDTAEEAISCPKGNIEIVEDKSTGLIYNVAFCPELMNYDSNYDNEQGISHIFQALGEIEWVVGPLRAGRFPG